jgi:hypothetical protein
VLTVAHLGDGLSAEGMSCSVAATSWGIFSRSRGMRSWRNGQAEERQRDMPSLFDVDEVSA